MLPTPKWKLVVDIGATATEADNLTEEGSSVAEDLQAAERTNIVAELVSMLGEYMPCDPDTPADAYTGFMSLRLMLLKGNKSDFENLCLDTILNSYTSYQLGNRSRGEIASLLVRDYAFLLQSQKAGGGGGSHQVGMTTIHPLVSMGSVKAPSREQSTLLQLQQPADRQSQNSTAVATTTSATTTGSSTSGASPLVQPVLARPEDMITSSNQSNNVNIPNQQTEEHGEM